jgi:hypothetical protein
MLLTVHVYPVKSRDAVAISHSPRTNIEVMYTGLTSYTGFNHYYFVELSDYYSEAKA